MSVKNNARSDVFYVFFESAWFVLNNFDNNF